MLNLEGAMGASGNPGPAGPSGAAGPTGPTGAGGTGSESNIALSDTIVISSDDLEERYFTLFPVQNPSGIPISSYDATMIYMGSTEIIKDFGFSVNNDGGTTGVYGYTLKLYRAPGSIGGATSVYGSWNGTTPALSAGDAFLIGATGFTIEEDYRYFWGATFTTPGDSSAITFSGSKFSTGLDGPTGPAGTTGAPGSTGASSTIPGPTGPAGATGPAGPTGGTGSAGPGGTGSFINKLFGPFNFELIDPYDNVFPWSVAQSDTRGLQIFSGSTGATATSQWRVWEKDEIIKDFTVLNNSEYFLPDSNIYPLDEFDLTVYQIPGTTGLATPVAIWTHSFSPIGATVHPGDIIPASVLPKFDVSFTVWK